MSDPKFYVYSKQGCGYCTQLTRFLQSRGLDYETFTLGEEYTLDQFLKKFGRGKSFPQVNYKNINLGGMRDTVQYIVAHKLHESNK